MPGCRIAEAIRLKHKPVALHWSDDKPENVVQFDKGSWGCVMFLVNADQLAGLVVLANRTSTDFVDTRQAGVRGA